MIKDRNFLHLHQARTFQGLHERRGEKEGRKCVSFVRKSECVHGDWVKVMKESGRGKS